MTRVKKKIQAAPAKTSNGREKRNTAAVTAVFQTPHSEERTQLGKTLPSEMASIGRMCVATFPAVSYHLAIARRFAGPRRKHC